MGVRQWTVDAIEEGGAGKWVVGLTIKGAFEFAAAIGLGWLLLTATSFVFPLDALRDVLGAYTRGMLWLLFSLGIAERFTICTFTSAFSGSEGTGERQSPPGEES